MIINRVGPLSVAKLSAFLYAIIGLILGGVFSLVAMVGGFSSDNASTAGMAVMGVGAVIVFPILYGLIGFVGSLLMAWLYNVTAGMIGGIEVDME